MDYVSMGLAGVLAVTLGYPYAKAAVANLTASRKSKPVVASSVKHPGHCVWSCEVIEAVAYAVENLPPETTLAAFSRAMHEDTDCRETCIHLLSPVKAVAA